MKWGQHKRKTIASVAFAFFVVTGTYNAVVINSESLISSADVRFIKRLDEVYGLTQEGHRAAASVQWQKLSHTASAPVREQVQIKEHVQSQVFQSTVEDISGPAVIAAAVQETLNLSLNEVVNSKKWPMGLPNTQFSGTLSTNNGVIESLSVSLPSEEGISVSFSEMAGNVFEYELNNEVYSGMMYQVDQSSYMVTLTNGPLEGTRLRFVGEPTDEQKEVIQQQVAEHDVLQTGNIYTYESDLTDKEAQQISLAPEEGVENNLQPENQYTM